MDGLCHAAEECFIHPMRIQAGASDEGRDSGLAEVHGIPGSEATARTHVSRIIRKLGLASRTQAALLAVREGLADEP